MTRLLFATDLHGNERSYAELLELARARGVDAVALGGDLLPHPRGRGAELVRGQRAWAREVLEPLLRRFRAAAPAARVYGLLGNDDWAACQEVLDAWGAEGLLHPLHLRAHPLDDRGRWVAGYGCVPVTPFGMSDHDRADRPGWQPPRPPQRVLTSEGEAVHETDLAPVLARPSIEEELAGLPSLSPPDRTVYVMHSPPAGTRLDVMHGGGHIGSDAIRRFVADHAPPLTLHGHIHESPRRGGSIFERLGPTLSINPGDSRTRLRAVLLDLDDLARDPELAPPAESAE